jgi:hypothetical protein
MSLSSRAKWHSLVAQLRGVLRPGSNLETELEEGMTTATSVSIRILWKPIWGKQRYR